MLGLLQSITGLRRYRFECWRYWFYVKRGRRWSRWVSSFTFWDLSLWLRTTLSRPSGSKGIGLMCSLQIPRAMLVVILNCPLETFTLVLELFQSIDEFRRYRFNTKLGAPIARVVIKLICSLRPLTLMYQSLIGFWRYRFNMKLGSWGGYHPELLFKSVVGFQKCLF